MHYSSDPAKCQILFSQPGFTRGYSAEITFSADMYNLTDPDALQNAIMDKLNHAFAINDLTVWPFTEESPVSFVEMNQGVIMIPNPWNVESRPIQIRM